jgi:hypothetical protein
VETKLLRNPESTRQVVAQVIDYIKAFSDESLEELIGKIKAREPEQIDRFTNDVNFASLVNENIRTGNFQVLIVGDYVHPNVLGMVSSIHSAPHLAFTIYLVDLNTYKLDSEHLILDPRVVSATTEIERSVIRIEIEPEKIPYRIQSQTPDKKGKGRKPILSWEQYIENVTLVEFKPVLQEFRDRWLVEIDNSINMGQVGFSAGLEIGGKRIPVQYVYDRYLNLVSEKQALYYEIPKPLYYAYLDRLKESSYLYDNIIASGKIEVKYEEIDESILQLLLDSAFQLALDLKGGQ